MIAILRLWRVAAWIGAGWRILRVIGRRGGIRIAAVFGETLAASEPCASPGIGATIAPVKRKRRSREMVL